MKKERLMNIYACILNRDSTMSEQSISLTQLLDTFQLFDTNKDGCISSNEVCQS